MLMRGPARSKPNNTLCATEFLTNLQSVTGPLTLSALEAFGSQIVASAVPNIPASVECTDCTKGWFNIVKQNFPGVVNSDAQQNVQDRCGAAFVGASLIVAPRAARPRLTAALFVPQTARPRRPSRRSATTARARRTPPSASRSASAARMRCPLSLCCRLLSRSLPNFVRDVARCIALRTLLPGPLLASAYPSIRSDAHIY